MQKTATDTYLTAVVRAAALKRTVDQEVSETNIWGQRLRLDPDYLAELISDKSPRIAVSNEEKKALLTRTYPKRSESLSLFCRKYNTKKTPAT